MGQLLHATMVCPLGKACPSGLFQVLRGMQHAHGQLRRLNLTTRADIALWHSLLFTWSGFSVHQFLALGQPDRHQFSEVSGPWGCGAWSPHTGSSSHIPTAMAYPELPDGTCSNRTCRCNMGESLKRSISHPDQFPACTASACLQQVVLPSILPSTF